MADERLSIELVMLIERYSRSMTTAIKEADAFDKQLLALIKTANRFEKVLDGLKAPKIAFDVDSSQIGSAEADLNAIDGLTPNVEILVDGSQVDSVEADLKTIDGATPDIDVKVDASQVDSTEADLTAMDGMTPDVSVDVDASQIETAQSDFDSLDGATGDITIDVKGDEDLEKADGIIQRLSKGVVIGVGMKIGEGIGGAIGGVAGGITQALGIDAANQLTEVQRRLQADLGFSEEKAAALTETVKELYQVTPGKTISEIAEQVVSVENLATEYDDLFTAVKSTSDASRLLGTSYDEQLQNANKLVAVDLADNITEANDALLQARRIGADENKDIAGVIEEFSSNFAGANFKLSEFITLSSEAFRVGGRNAELVGETVLEMQNSITEAFTNKESDQFDILKKLGLRDEARLVSQGELSGAAFMQSFFDETSRQLEAGDIRPVDASKFISTFFGSNAENFGLESLMQIDWDAVLNSSIATGAVEESAQILDDTFSAQIGELGRTVETELAGSFRIAGMTLSDLLDGAKEKVREIADLIQSGHTIPEAIEIALNIPGFADSINQFESVMGNLVLDLGTILANVLSAIPGQEGAVASIRGGIKEQAVRQLMFDVELAEDDERALSNAVQRAIDRGVEQTSIDEALGTAVDQMIAGGDLSAAQDLLEQFNELPNVLAKIRIGHATTTLPLTLDPELSDQQIHDVIEKKADEAIAGQFGMGGFLIQSQVSFERIDVDTAGSQAAVTSAVDDLKAQFDQAMIMGDFDTATAVADQLAPLEEVFNEALSDENFDLAQAIADALGDADLTAVVNDLRTEAGDTISRFDELKEKASSASEEGIKPLGESADGTREQLFNLKNEGIDPTKEATDGLAESTNLYVTGVQEGLQVAKYSWDDYFKYVESLKLSMLGSLALAGVGAIGGLGTGADHNAGGGVMNPGLSFVGEKGTELISSDTALAVLNNMTTNSLIQGVQMALSGLGSSNTNTTINVNIINNNANQAAGVASGDRFNAAIRGFR